MDQPFSKTVDLKRCSMEFVDPVAEKEFLHQNWSQNIYSTQLTLLVVIFLTVSFFVRDLLETTDMGKIPLLLFSRITMTVILIIAILILRRSKQYFAMYPVFVLGIQIIISIALFILAVIREMPVAYLAVNTMVFTFIFYQFMSNRFSLTVLAALSLGFGAVVTSLVYLGMDGSLLLASILVLIPINFLGATMLRSINRARRLRFAAIKKLQRANIDKEKAIEDLKRSLEEVKTLRNFIPICAQCKKVRDDEGYWNQIETYLQNQAAVEISHGICPDCQQESYNKENWFKNQKEKTKRSKISERY